MKKWIYVLLFPLLFEGCTQKLSESQRANLWKAYREQNYFRLDKLVNTITGKDNNPEMLLFKSKLGYVFNQPEASNKAIETLLNKYPVQFNDTLLSDLHFMRAVNYTRLEEYRKALAEGNLFVEKYASLYDSSYIAEMNDDNKVREALLDVPQMEALKTTDVQISIKRDRAGLINLPVVLSSDSVDFVFDSGANMSVIIESVAKKYGFKTLGKKINVLAITGKSIQAELALVDLKMGNIPIKNSPFIVFPDSVLTFANGAYVIRGIIGYPIMNALKEFTVKDDQFLLIPKVPGKSSTRNFALDQATPVIMVKFNNDTLPFHFDTGADRTMFYSSFFGRYKDYVLKNCPKTADNVGGAGGIMKIESYKLNNAVLFAGEAEAQLDSVRILTRPLLSNQKQLYGNFGQDFMRQYKEMTVNFESMHIQFAEKKVK